MESKSSCLITPTSHKTIVFARSASLKVLNMVSIRMMMMVTFFMISRSSGVSINADDAEYHGAVDCDQPEEIHFQSINQSSVYPRFL